MDVTDITPQLDQLDVDLDKLEDALKPLLRDLSDVASSLPLLDKAKLYVLATYSIESTLYCKTVLDATWYSLSVFANASLAALRLNGIDAKSHPIMKELTRVRQYFEKIKKAEEPPAERTQSVDTQAAIRFIKADLVCLFPSDVLINRIAYVTAGRQSGYQQQAQGAACKGAC